MLDDRQILLELLFELDHIAHVVNAFVEPSGELRRDRLNRDSFIRNGGQDNQQLPWSLRRIRFVHRNFRDELPFAFYRLDVPVDLARLRHREQILAGRLRRRLSRYTNRLGDALDLVLPDDFRMPRDERINRSWRGWTA